MITDFYCKETENIFNGVDSKKFKAIKKVAKRKLDMLHFAVCEKDLLAPPSNRFEHLKGEYKGFCSIRINDQFRIMFKFENGKASKVRIIDYH